MIFGGFYNGWTNNFIPYPLIDGNEEGQQMKMPHESYEVYVNKDFIGHKLLLNESEDIREVDEFLNSRGFYQFKTEQNGIRYSIYPADSYQAEVMKENLHVYLQIR